MLMNLYAKLIGQADPRRKPETKDLKAIRSKDKIVSEYLKKIW